MTLDGAGCGCLAFEGMMLFRMRPCSHNPLHPNYNRPGNPGKRKPPGGRGVGRAIRLAGEICGRLAQLELNVNQDAMYDCLMVSRILACRLASYEPGGF